MRRGAWMRLVLACALAPAPGIAQGPQPAREALLARPMSVTFQDAGLAEALLRLRHEQDLPLAWSGDILPPRHRVSLTVTGQPLGAVLAMILEGSGLEFVVARDGTLVVVPRSAKTAGSDPADDARALDLALGLAATGVRQLDELIVMGTPVARAPEREQPTAISVMQVGELAGAAHTRLGDLMRTLLPGVVLWDAGPSGGPPQVTSVRGVSSFTSRGLKGYVDGVELASSDFFPVVDGRGITRIEVLRGPQGAALYGPDALNGILQVETRRGEPGGAPRMIRGSATAGPHEPGDGMPGALWQDHALGAGLNGPRWGVEVNGSLARAGEEGGVPWQRVMTGQVGGTAFAGPVVIRGSARAGRFEYGLRRPASTLAVSVPHQLDEQAAGLTLVHDITPRWRQTLTLGYHRVSGPRDPTRSFLLDPRLPLGATHETAARTGIRYATALEVDAATLSGGVEHASRGLERSVRRTPTGRDFLTLFEDDLISTGAYGQARLRLGPQLVISAGTRAEWGSSVGATTGATWASTAGMSWTRRLGRQTLRLRAAWGRGLRLPEPGMSRAMATATVQQQANEELVAERQSGVEAGADLFLGSGGWLKVTWYEQHADDLIQQVRVRVDDVTRAFQFQNVGAIRNQGMELEAGTRLGSLSVAGLLYLTASTVERIAPRYSGELRPGDPLPDVPASVGSLVVRHARGSLTAEAGASWLGSWTGYDRAAALAVEDGTAPPRDSPRDFWIEYPAVVRPWVAVGLDLGRGVAAFLRADNPTQSTRFIRDNLSPPLGRTTVIGVTVQR